MPKNSKKSLQLLAERIATAIKKLYLTIRSYILGFIKRRPHRSFQLTRRRDYARSLQLPGFFAFTRYVNKTLWRHRKVFILLAFIYAVLTAVLIGIGSQDTYSALTSTLRDTGGEAFKGNFGELGKAGLLFLSIASSGLTTTPTESQQIYTVTLFLLVWLTTVWLLRNLLAGHKVRVRDGLYSAGAPLVSTFLVSLVLTVQLIPLAVAVVGYSAASTSGLLEGGVEAMLFWCAAALLTTLSLYWMTSTFFALIIVSLPGMYPMHALRTAGDMVIGRRLRILLRILWMFVVVGVTWVVILLPFILLDGGIKSLWPMLEGVPVVPVILMLLSVGSMIWSAGYVYLLYRKVVDDDAKPAL